MGRTHFAIGSERVLSWTATPGWPLVASLILAGASLCGAGPDAGKKAPTRPALTKAQRPNGARNAVTQTATNKGHTPGPMRTTPPPDAVDYVPRLVGRTFLRAVAEKDLDTARSLCADTVQFDGNVAGTTVRVAEALRAMMKRVPASMKFVKVAALNYGRMVERFGPPPRRLAGTRFKGSVVVLGRLARGGLIAVLNKIDGRWRVVALTD